MKGEDKHEPFRKIDAGLLSEAEWEQACESEEFFSGRGTLYIKQVDRMPPSSQRLLLRRISEPYDGPRLIVSSSRRRAGEFLSDLYDALCHLELDVPPLYERKEDILHLAYLFIAESNEAFGKQIVGFRSEAGVLLEEAKWPGNLSQLRKTVQNCVLEAQGVYIEKADAERVLSRLKQKEKTSIYPERSKRSKKESFKKSMPKKGTIKQEQRKGSASTERRFGEN